jgi:hypothetical protein
MRVVRGVVCGVGGLVTSVAAVMVHQRWWGIALAVAAVAAAAVALPAGWWTRLPFALGFVVVLGLGMVPRGEGDYLIPGNARGYVLLALGFVLVLTAVATLPRPERLPRMDP